MAVINFGGTKETVVTRQEFTLAKARKVLKNEVVAVIGYGVQGPAQALNMKDNGINVVEVTSEQKDAFIESAASVYDLFIEKYGGTQELIDLAMKYNDDF